MIATLFAFLIALYMGYSTHGMALITTGGAWEALWPLCLLASGALIFALAALLQVLAYFPLQRAEYKTGPQIFTLWRESRVIKAAWLIWSATPFAVLACVVLAHLWSTPALSLAALPLLGMAVDAILFFLIEVRKFLNPFSLIYVFAAQAKKAWAQGKDTQVLRWFDALEETGQRALDLNCTALCRSTCKQLYFLLEHFLQRDVRLKIRPESGKALDEKEMERARYILSAFFQHLETLNNKALSSGNSYICDEFISLFGKTTLILASTNIDLAIIPITHLGSLGKKAMEREEEELATRSSCALLAVAKGTPFIIDAEQVDLYPFTHAIIGYMQELAHLRFRHNKEIPLEELTKPFNDLQLFFKDEELSARSDVERIQESISRVLEEFAALELVMYKFPMGNNEEEEDSEEDEPDEDLGSVLKR